MSFDRGVTIGVNHVDAKHPAPFNATLATLTYAESTAKHFAALAGAPGPKLLGADAKAAAVEKAVRAAAAGSAGKRVLVSFHGHGLQLTDVAGAATRGVIDCWCLADTPVRDDEILALLALFDATAEVVVVSDCCYGGGIVDGRDAPAAATHVKAAVVAMAAAGPNEPAFAASGKAKVSAFVAAMEKELTDPAHRPARYSEMQTRLRAALAKNAMRQTPTMKAFGRIHDVDQMTPFWSAAR